MRCHMRECNYYEYIGLSQDATRREIKDRCNALMHDYAPDKCRDICFEEANETLKLIVKIRQNLLDDKKRKAYDLTLAGISHESKCNLKPTVVRYCKEKDGERCHEEEGIALLECSGCPNCTDPKVLKRRL